MQKKAAKMPACTPEHMKAMAMTTAMPPQDHVKIKNMKGKSKTYLA